MTFRLRKIKETNWFEYVGEKRSLQQQRIDDELLKQVSENGVYSIFDKSNSKEEIIKRLNKNEDRKIEKMKILINRKIMICSVFAVIVNFMIDYFK